MSKHKLTNAYQQHINFNKLNVLPALNAAVMSNVCTFNHYILGTTSVLFRPIYYTGNKHHVSYYFYTVADEKVKYFVIKKPKYLGKQ